MFIITLTYTAPLDQIDVARPAHLEWLKGHFATGRFVVSGRQNPPVGGVIIAKGTRAEVEDVVKADPYNVQGLADYNLTEFVAGMTAPGLESLKG